MLYNTKRDKLILPEYGRNVQNMVNHCLTIENDEEREKCAYAIIDVMGGMFPHLRDDDNFKHVLWDHLAIMSGFKLKINYPYEVIKEEELNTPPGKIAYSRPGMQYRHYGKIIEKMIDIAAEMEDGDEKEQLVRLILNQMKRAYIQWNKNIDDDKIFQDLASLSNNRLVYSSEDYTIPDVKLTQTYTSKKKSKSNRRR
ncbi:MAG: DUF4290 domain-containing protein [Fermentimonas sp.]|jgi:hypothetical protein